MSNKPNDNERLIREQEIKSFFEQAEAARVIKPGTAAAPSADSPKPFGSAAVAVEVFRRVPAVVRKTRLQWLNDPYGELISEFFVMAAAQGLQLIKPGFAHGQYITYLLYQAANRLKAQYTGKVTVTIGLPEAAMAIAAISDEADEEPPKPKPDPVQTVAQVKALLAELSEDLGRTANRVWFDGQKRTVVAKEENVTPGAISTRLHRVRRHLSARLGIPINLRETSCRPRPRSRRMRARRANGSAPGR